MWNDIWPLSGCVEGCLKKKNGGFGDLYETTSEHLLKVKGNTYLQVEIFKSDFQIRSRPHSQPTGPLTPLMNLSGELKRGKRLWCG